MERGEQKMRKGTGTLYRIVVQSELSERLATAFEGMEMETKGRTDDPDRRGRPAPHSRHPRSHRRFGTQAGKCRVRARRRSGRRAPVRQPPVVGSPALRQRPHMA